MERVTGIEPALSAWKAGVLPLNYTRICSATNQYTPLSSNLAKIIARFKHLKKMVGTTGFEPATSCSQSRRATKLRHVPTN